jgi:hypothetical protein
MTRKLAKLRVCASCKWIFSNKHIDGCPKCSFAHYGAHYVYGNKAYYYQYSQKPWKDKKLIEYGYTLQKIIDENNRLNKPRINKFRLVV